MNDYEIETYYAHNGNSGTRLHAVKAHTAADALTMVQHELTLTRPQSEHVVAVRCVERDLAGVGCAQHEVVWVNDVGTRFCKCGVSVA